MSLKKYLTNKKYCSVKLKHTNSSHLEIKAKINGIKGRFILDTGASNSCIGTEEIDKFQLIPEESEHKAAGAGTTEIETKISKNNLVEIGDFKLNDVDLVLIDLSHINAALIKQKAGEVQGIIGADILMETSAIIDYKKKKLYLLNS